ncbi:MAG: DUF2807 domain-containing protein [Candidatus Eremiobacteraeota bacterium]|nr:DUF2807 domain-containing protein [Candidatus Eremiobacteraeota bacterium]
MHSGCRASRSAAHPKRPNATAREADIVSHGSGDGNFRLASGGSLNVAIFGSADMTAVGETDRVVASPQGSGDLSAGALRARDVSVESRGSGNARVYASESLDALVSGSGDVSYGGNPKRVTKKVSGSGDISSF